MDSCLSGDYAGANPGGYMGADDNFRRGSLQPPYPTDLAMPKFKAGLEEFDSKQDFEVQPKQTFRKQFMKTSLCRYHLRIGCNKGANCEFAHGMHELSQPPDLRRTSICKDWLEGKCQASAETCKFAHGKEMLRRTICNQPAADLQPSAGIPAKDYRTMTSWEQRLLMQQEEHEQMRQTIKEQQRTIDALIQMQTGGLLAPGRSPMPKEEQQIHDHFPHQRESMPSDCPPVPQNEFQTLSGRKSLQQIEQHFQHLGMSVPSGTPLLPQNDEQMPLGIKQLQQIGQHLSQHSKSMPSDVLVPPLRATFQDGSFNANQLGFQVMHV